MWPPDIRGFSEERSDAADRGRGSDELKENHTSRRVEGKVVIRILIISPSVFRSPAFIRGQLLGDGKERSSKRFA